MSTPAAAGQPGPHRIEAAMTHPSFLLSLLRALRPVRWAALFNLVEGRP